MEKMILLHGSGHRADSWNETVSYLKNRENVLCPELSGLLNGREASYPNLRAAFGSYCAQIDGAIHLCGLSLGGILSLDYTLEHPEKVKTLVLIGTPYKIPKAAFALQNVVFRFLPKSAFHTMAFEKKEYICSGKFHEEPGFQRKSEQCPVPCSDNLRGKRPFQYQIRALLITEYPKGTIGDS